MRASPRVRRIVGRVLRAPAALDRRGLRWLLHLLSPAPIVVLVHRGRRSGRVYSTPVEVIAGDPNGGEIVVAPLWGERTHWYRNIVAGGLLEVHVRGEPRRVEWRELGDEDRRRATAAYREGHPLYGRGMLRTLVWLHGLDGEPVEAVARSLPMLALTRATAPPQ